MQGGTAHTVTLAISQARVIACDLRGANCKGTHVLVQSLGTRQIVLSQFERRQLTTGNGLPLLKSCEVMQLCHRSSLWW